MTPQSRGWPMPGGFQSKSTPTLPTVRSMNLPRMDHAETQWSSDEQSDERPGIASNASPRPLEPLSLVATEENALPSLAMQELDRQESTDEEELEDEDTIRHTQTLPTSKSYTHLRPMSASSSMLFPPFYNRPPTPLPPSPSLTSLLRPSFSTHNSRPTTPETSDTEGIHSHAGTAGTSANGTSTPTSTAAAVAKSARTATTVPRASPKIPTYEYYGFAVYLASSAAFLMYLLWSFLPSPILHQLGIYYYPNRWWALAVPAWLVVAVLWIYAALAGYNTEYLTLKMNSIENLVDEAAQIAVVDREGRIARRNRVHGRGPGTGKPNHVYDGLQPGKDGIGPCEESVASGRGWRDLWNEGTDAVMDVPIGGVCEILYGDGRDLDDDDDDDAHLVQNNMHSLI